jgi:hypothetical protein
MSVPTSGYKLWSSKDLRGLLEKYRCALLCTLMFRRGCVGGQPATQQGLEAFVQRVFEIDPMRLDGDKKNPPTNPEFIAAMGRVQGEIGERNLTPAQGEVEEKKVYGVNVVRQSPLGPFLLEHQVKAGLKQSASRLGMFQRMPGSKGDLAELGTVMARGDSLQNPDRPWELYIRKDGRPAKTEFTTLRGSVQTPKGKKSIQYEAETIEEGATVSFELRWPPDKLTRNHMAEVVAGLLAVGLGSARSLGYGQVDVVEFAIEERKTISEDNAEQRAAKKAKKANKAEAGGEGEVA